MNIVSIKNFRSIVDSGNVPVNRVNILLGKNSSGKSSFIRLFPMIKQTINHRMRGPLLWFDEYYDLGKFETALSRHAIDEKLIMLGFDIEKAATEPSCKTDNCIDCSYIHMNPNLFLDGLKKVKTEVFIDSHKDETYIKKIVVTFKKHRVEIEKNKIEDPLIIKIDEEQYFEGCMDWTYRKSAFLPRLMLISNSEIDKIQEQLNKMLKSVPEVNEKFFNALYNIRSLHVDDVKNSWEKKSDNPIFSMLLKHIAIKPDDTKKIISYLILVNLQRAIKFVDGMINSFFDNSYYIAPYRYNYGRYMRNKELSVETVDPIGKNLMEYILGMSKDELKDYKMFMKESFGAVFTVKGKDHKSIMVEKDGENDNLVDVGSGFSQILPVATLLWDLANRNGKYCGLPNTVAIEQPEIHLHPAMQREFADMIVNVIGLSKKNSNNLNIIIETHSPTIINRIGRLIRRKESDINEKDISIYLFDKVDGATKITTTAYNEDGRISNWPIGFLD
jgi:predicted ATPase